MMERRTFVTGAVSLLAAPLAAEGQQAAKVYQVGLLSNGGNLTTWRAQYAPFIEAMRELNYVEGRNLVIRPAFADGKAERLPTLVADLVSAKVDVIVSSATTETVTAKRATSSIPIVMWLVDDPVGVGLVASLARPGSNVTGLTRFVEGLSQKYVELLREVVPSASRFAVVASPLNPRPDIRREFETAGRVLGVLVSIAHVSNAGDFDDVLGSGEERWDSRHYRHQRCPHRRTLAEMALKHRLPGIYWSREYVDVGGLMTYSANINALRRGAATYVDKILRGANPVELPVERPTTFELIINARTAKALGLTILQSLLLRADQVIE